MKSQARILRTVTVEFSKIVKYSVFKFSTVYSMRILKSINRKNKKKWITYVK